MHLSLTSIYSNRSNKVCVRLSIWVNSVNLRMLTSNDTSPDLSLLNISLTVSHTISLTYSNSNNNMIIYNHSRVWVEISILHRQLSDCDISQKSSTCIITKSFNMLFYILMSHHQMLCWNWLHSRCEFNRVGACGHSRQNSLYLLQTLVSAHKHLLCWTRLLTYLLVSLVHVGHQYRDDVVSVVKVGVCLQDFTQAFSGQHRQGLWTKKGIKPKSHSISQIHQLLFTTILFS